MTEKVQQGRSRAAMMKVAALTIARSSMGNRRASATRGIGSLTTTFVKVNAIMTAMMFMIFQLENDLYSKSTKVVKVLIPGVQFYSV